MPHDAHTGSRQQKSLEMRSPDSCLAQMVEMARAANSRGLALFLDYDGTLTPIVARPGDAILTPETRNLLRQLAATLPLAVVSGRDLEDVRQLVALDGLDYVGSHGLDIAALDGTRQEGEAFRPAILRAGAALEQALSGIDRVLIQPKRYAITVHVRHVSVADKPTVEQKVMAVLAGEPTLRHMGGKEMHELRPDSDWHKGSAIAHLLTTDRYKGRIPVFIGDDVTDEDGFRAVADGGLGIRVGASDTSAASVVIADVAAVHHLLEGLTRYFR